MLQNGTSQLKAKQKRFCDEYIKDLNGAQAAIRAGYSTKSAKEQAAFLLTNPNIKQYVTDQMLIIREKTEVSQRMVIEELRRIAFADMADYVKIGDEGDVQIIPFNEMVSGASRAVAKVKEHRRILGSGEGGKEMILETRLEYAHHDKMKALELLGKHLGMYVEQVNVSGNLELSITREVIRKEQS